jgi:hypothetical protein
MRTPIFVQSPQGARSPEVQVSWTFPALAQEINLEAYEFDAERVGAQVEAGEGDGQLEAARTGASRIHINDAVFLELCGLVRVAANDHGEAGGLGIQVQRVQVVKDENQD